MHQSTDSREEHQIRHHSEGSQFATETIRIRLGTQRPTETGRFHQLPEHVGHVALHGGSRGVVPRGFAASSGAGDHFHSRQEELMYDLVGVLIHSGSAAFGHYYAFLKNWTDNKWYKFNDEHVSEVTEEEVLSQQWSGWQGRSSSSSPYMLVYRQAVPPPPVGIADSEIPSPILSLITKEGEEKEIRRIEREKELNSCTITVFRNRLELPVDSSTSFNVQDKTNQSGKTNYSFGTS